MSSGAIARPTRVVHLVGSAAPAYAAHARIVSALARHLDRAAYEIRAWFLGGEGVLDEMLEADGVPTRHVRFGGVRDLPGAVRMLRALRTERPAIVHVHSGGRSAASLARRAGGARVLAHVHGTHTDAGDPAMPTRLVRGVDRVIATSNTVAKALPRESVVIRPGVDPIPPRKHGPGGSPVVGMMTRLEPVKGVRYLLEATALLASSHPGFRVEIAGVGSQRVQLEELARDLGIADRVAFLGWLDDPTKALGRWDIAVSASLSEGFGIGVLEGMAAGLPTVASATGGSTELVDDGRTGFLFAVRDAAELADRLAVLLDDRPLRAAIGEAAARRVRTEFSAASMARQVGALYEETLNA
jgi:glycosyltransferase involved in cell wall biosynthesis